VLLFSRILSYFTNSKDHHFCFQNIFSKYFIVLNPNYDIYILITSTVKCLEKWVHNFFSSSQDVFDHPVSPDQKSHFGGKKIK